MNSSASDWNTKVHQYFDRLHPSVISSFNNIQTHNILVIIGFITVCLLVCLLIMQCILKVRYIYQTTEPKKSRRSKLKYPSYQQLLDTDNKQCKCLQYSCLPKFQCVKSNYQILNPSSYYEQIDERQIANSICRVHIPHPRSCVRVHIIK